MKIFSNDFSDNQFLVAKFTCDGENIRPHLSWSDIPVAAKSLALAIFDPDAPMEGFLHWLVVNLPPKNTELNSGDVLPLGAVQIKNDAGKFEYYGPCPPQGVHRYQFTLYALAIESINPINYKDFLQQIDGHIIEQARLTGLYQKKISNFKFVFF